MDVGPVCAAANTLGHSLPGPRWWLGLNAAEQAGWAAAVMGLLAALGGAAAALASFRAANVALSIAQQQAERENARFDRRAETHAAGIFTEVALVVGYLDQLQSLAENLATSVPDDTYSIARVLFENVEIWSKLVNRVPLDSIMELPEACAPHMAGAFSSARMLVMQGSTLLNKWTASPEDFDRVRRIAQSMSNRCVEIRSNLQPYLSFAKETFGSDME
ncbi:hypothetical protein [Dyella sp.]|uniref:hypothetical protein n=1 Tax=Dyella sp. TaxID=1869338 RepID=UPI0028408B68|nr:hypothetical protein [Dyella sp.]MDR3444728.1 hypothetical protein [Dyella sp.]